LIFYARLVYFLGVHEIAALSWFFYIKVKEQEIKSNVNSSKTRMLQYCNFTFTPKLLKVIYKTAFFQIRWVYL